VASREGVLVGGLRVVGMSINPTAIGEEKSTDNIRKNRPKEAVFIRFLGRFLSLQEQALYLNISDKSKSTILAVSKYKTVGRLLVSLAGRQ
jgi:hypothetical protein